MSELKAGDPVLIDGVWSATFLSEVSVPAGLADATKFYIVRIHDDNEIYTTDRVTPEPPDYHDILALRRNLAQQAMDLRQQSGMMDDTWDHIARTPYTLEELAISVVRTRDALHQMSEKLHSWLVENAREVIDSYTPASPSAEATETVDMEMPSAKFYMDVPPARRLALMKLKGKTDA